MINLIIDKIQPITSFFAATPSATKCAVDNSFFGFPHWWQYLPKDPLDACKPLLNVNDATGSVNSSLVNDTLLPIGLAVLNMFLHLAGILAFFYVILAGAKYVISAGNSERTSGALKSIINTGVGMLIILTAIPVVSYIGKSFQEKTQNKLETIPNVAADQSVLQTIATWLFAGIGGLSVIMVVWGGLSYVLGQGNSDKLTNARKTIIYALVGLAVSIFASVIVRVFMDTATK